MDNPIITENIHGVEVSFKTKSGVFSKAGLDSGSKLLIDSMEIKDGTLVADLGCGTGVIGFVAAKLNPSGHVHILDVNLRTIELAKENAELNKFKNVEVFLSDIFSAVPDRTYHTILSNPPQHLGNEFLEETALECFNHLKPGGVTFWVMQNHLKPVSDRLFQKYFGNCKIVSHGREHVVLKAVKKGG